MRIFCSFLILVVLWVTACGRTTGLTPVEVSHQTSEISRRTEIIVGLEAQLESKIARLEDLAKTFNSVNLSYAAPFPRDLFRHAAMACVTEAPWAETEPGTQVEVVADKLGLRCKVVALPTLESELSLLDSRQRTAAVAILQALDALRILRDELDLTLRQTPETVNDTGRYIALARADLRQIEGELNRRRPEYVPADFETSKSRIQNTRETLDHLESLIKDLSAHQEERQIRVESVIRATYRSVAMLGEP